MLYMDERRIVIIRHADLTKKGHQGERGTERGREGERGQWEKKEEMEGYLERGDGERRIEGRGEGQRERKQIQKVKERRRTGALEDKKRDQ